MHMRITTFEKQIILSPEIFLGSNVGGFMSDFGCVDLLCQMAAFFLPTMVLTASKFCWILPEESPKKREEMPHPCTSNHPTLTF